MLFSQFEVPCSGPLFIKLLYQSQPVKGPPSSKLPRTSLDLIEIKIGAHVNYLFGNNFLTRKDFAILPSPFYIGSGQAQLNSTQYGQGPGTRSV